MIKSLINKYSITHYIENSEVSRTEFEQSNNEFKNLYRLLNKYGGQIFDSGLFQICTFNLADKWTTLLTLNYFPELRYKVYCFAITWQGIILAVNDQNSGIYLFDPATCEYFEMEDISLESFLEDSFIQNEDEIIYPEDFRNSLKHLKITTLEDDKCVAHKVSLFLGGEDEYENLEIINTEVMWDLQIQVAESINEIPD